MMYTLKHSFYSYGSISNDFLTNDNIVEEATVDFLTNDCTPFELSLYSGLNTLS